MLAMIRKRSSPDLWFYSQVNEDGDTKTDILNLLKIASLALTNKYNSDSQLDEMYYNILQTLELTMQSADFSRYSKRASNARVGGADSLVLEHCFQRNTTQPPLKPLSTMPSQRSLVSASNAGDVNKV